MNKKATLLIVFIAASIVGCATKYEQGSDALWKGQYNNAILLLLEEVHENPNNYFAYNDLGVAYYSIGQNTRSIEALENAVEINKNYIKAYYNLSLVYRAIGQLDNAIENLDIIINLAQYIPSQNLSPEEREDVAKAAYELRTLKAEQQARILAEQQVRILAEQQVRILAEQQARILAEQQADNNEEADLAESTIAVARFREAIDTCHKFIFKAAHLSGVFDNVSIEQTQSGTNSALFVENFEWHGAISGRNYQTTIYYTISYSMPDKIDYITIAAKDANNPSVSAFFASDVTKSFLLHFASDKLKEYRLISVIIKTLNSSLNIKDGIGIILKEMANSGESCSGWPKI